MYADPSSKQQAQGIRTVQQLEREIRAEIEQRLSAQFEADKRKFILEVTQQIEAEVRQEQRRQAQHRNRPKNAGLKTQLDPPAFDGFVGHAASNPKYVDISHLTRWIEAPLAISSKCLDTPFSMASDGIYALDCVDAPPGLGAEVSNVAGCRHPGREPLSKFKFEVRSSVFSSTNRSQALDAFKLLVNTKEMAMQLHITAEETSDKKHGRSFKTSRGKGMIELKCRDHDPADAQLEISASIGNGQKQSHRSRLVLHNFATKPTVGIPSQLENWAFSEAADANTTTVIVCVEFRKSS